MEIESQVGYGKYAKPTYRISVDDERSNDQPDFSLGGKRDKFDYGSNAVDKNLKNYFE